MSELTLLLLRFGFLLLLWMFIFAIVYALRSDLFGAPVRRLKKAEGKEVFASRPQPSPAITPSGGAMPLAPPAQNSGAAQRLVITSGVSAGTELPLDNTPVTIGRSSDSTLVILDEYTSTQHAQLIPGTSGWMLQDLDSTNGTLLAGQKVIGSVQLPLNTPVSIGKTTFELRA
jgi:pSer/pThr/pTyr-binding forkhead associated (FHA) protein